MLRLHGGSSTSNVYNHLDTTLSGGGDEDLCDLPGLVTITNERDGIALDDDPSVKRAKMPCGHVMGNFKFDDKSQSLATFLLFHVLAILYLI